MISRRFATRHFRLFSTLTPTEKQLQEKRELVDQRHHFEDMLKVGAASVTGKTDASSLVKLLRMAVFVEDRDSQLVAKLLDLLQPKVFTLENEEIASLHAALVLIP